MIYGLPYRGSKNKIAKWIVDLLPPGKVFVDLFSGGGAITHAVLLSGKWKHIIMNDANGWSPMLFMQAVKGELSKRNDWVSRDRFIKEKDIDPFIKLFWSFWNDGESYLYGKHIEPLKKAAHLAIYEDDYRALKELGVTDITLNGKDIYKRYQQYRKQMSHYWQNGKCTLQQKIKRIESIERLKRLESIERLESLSISISYKDYKKVYIPKDAIIYCNPPYANTNCGKCYCDEFNHEEFYQWALKIPNLFVSEYYMPEPFVQIAEKKKTVQCGNNGCNGYSVEKLYYSPATQYIQTKENVQLSLYD